MFDINTFLINLFSSLGGAVGISVIIIKAFGNKLLENQFKKGLEKYKFLINSKFDRISKIHEKEFEILPQLWEMLLNVRSILYGTTQPYQEYPNLDGMEEEEIIEYLDSINIKKSQKNKILREESKKNDLFLEIEYRRRLNELLEAYALFDKSYHYNKIFLKKDLIEDIKNVRTGFISGIANIKTALMKNKINYEYIIKAYEIIDKQNDLVEKIAMKIQERLRFDEAY